MFRLVFTFCLLTLLIACKKNDEQKKGKKKPKVEQKSISESGKITLDGLSFDYKYDNSKDATEIKIIGKNEDVFNANGKITKYFFSDLDADTKDEVFIVLTDKNGSSTLKSFYILGGNALEISMNQVANAPPNSTTTYTSKYGQIIEKIEVKTPDNKSIKSSARYNLVTGESTYSLKPQGWTKEQLKTKRGQYKTGMYGKKYYNKIYINESESGEWIVDIKVKDSKTERNICEFQAIGEFINKDLFVPMKYADPSLDGVLQIRYAGKSIVVYTQDKEDAKQMATFCKGFGNLSGNYTRLKILYEE